MAHSKDKSNDSKLKTLQEWKKSYITALIKTFRPSGDVLEIGFNNGTAAEAIQTFHPKSHTIIESDPHTAKEAIKWAKKHPHIHVIQDTWQHALPDLGAFDSIFFNDYPPESDLEIMGFLYPEDTIKSTSQAKDVFNQLKTQISQIKIKYSDREIDEFYQKIGQFNEHELPAFFKMLKDNGNITKKQLETILHKYHLSHAKENNKSAKQAKNQDVMLEFLIECFEDHLRNKGRFTCFLSNPSSKYEDFFFFESVITNPFIDYKEDPLTVDMSDRSREALLIVVEKNA